MIFPFVAGELPISKEGSNGADFPPYIEACARCSTWHGGSSDAFWMSICTHRYRSHNLAGNGWALAWQMLADLDLDLERDFVRFLGCWTQLNHHNRPVFWLWWPGDGQFWVSLQGISLRMLGPVMRRLKSAMLARVRCFAERAWQTALLAMHLGHSMAF